MIFYKVKQKQMHYLNGLRLHCLLAICTTHRLVSDFRKTYKTYSPWNAKVAAMMTLQHLGHLWMTQELSQVVRNVQTTHDVRPTGISHLFISSLTIHLNRYNLNGWKHHSVQFSILGSLIVGLYESSERPLRGTEHVRVSFQAADNLIDPMGSLHFACP